MNRLLLFAIAMTAWILFTAIDRGSFLDKIAAMPLKTSGNAADSLPTIEQNSGLKDNSLQDRVQSELYSSISTGMSYAEVESIIGWSGILIYENNDDRGGEVIQTKVYRWNSDHLHLNDVALDKPIDRDSIALDKDIVLEFQNDVLIELSFTSHDVY